MNKLHDLLKGIYLFKHFDNDELAKIAKIAKAVPHAPRSIIFYDGDPASVMYVVQFGTVRLLKKGAEEDQEIAKLGPGSHFGEMPYLDESMRAGTVEAIEQSTILEISYSDLKKTLDGDNKMAADFYREVAHFLAVRLRKLSADYSELREKTIRQK